MAFRKIPGKLKWLALFILSINYVLLCGGFLLLCFCENSFLSSVRPQASLRSSLNICISFFSCYLLSIFSCHFVMMLQFRLTFCKTDLFYGEPRLRHAICCTGYQLSISFEVLVSSPFFPFNLWFSFL